MAAEMAALPLRTASSAASCFNEAAANGRGNWWERIDGAV